MKRMEISGGLSPRTSSGAREKPKGMDSNLQNLEWEVSNSGSALDHHFHSLNAVEILRETVWILRYNLMGFLSIAALLICPVSAVALSNVLVDQSMVKILTIRLLLVAKSSGLSLRPFVRQSVQKFSEMVISSAMCFPLYVVFLLLSKAAIVYSVDCTYSRRKFNPSKFFVIITKIWKRVVVTYLWACCLISGCLMLFLVLLVVVCSTFSIMGFPSDLILYPAMVVGMIFSIILANCTIICSVAVVISVLEEVSGPQALLRSSSLIKGQTQVGLLIFLGSTIGNAFVEGLFEHRVKALSYADGSSRAWEGPLLVIMYSFMLLIDSMMSTVFYFSCKSYRMERANEESQPVLEALAIP
ncbi:uncharacterized protein LOC116026214 [Ipomoea triloba]|uniref:uncharacterized protein LOC116026214 n=1 Tax=Ipomoea triloba TaxID=35885 RepID=UPI00125DEECE|nr:uncharacterized protein LOC116026214 [Ipomoea triloba]XP_031123552.1 uncharacterized protein LOC116026214 [Ipomoea triloba]XP_031123553.1 uncharacterized protein LOC116026214 [Ipomoea triloba]